MGTSVAVGGKTREESPRTKRTFSLCERQVLWRRRLWWARLLVFKRRVCGSCAMCALFAVVLVPPVVFASERFSDLEIAFDFPIVADFALDFSNLEIALDFALVFSIVTSSISICAGTSSSTDHYLFLR